MEGEDIPPWPPRLLALASQTATGTAPGRLEAPPSADAVVRLLEAMPNPEHVDRDQYTQINLAVQGCIRTLDGDESDRAGDIMEAAADWAARWPRTPGVEFERRKWDSDWSTCTNDLCGWRHLVGHAKALGIDVSEWDTQLNPDAAEQFKDAPLPAGTVDQEAEFAAVMVNSQGRVISESELSDEFVKVYGNQCRWDGSRGAWFTWAGTHWRRDEGSLAFHWAKLTIRQHVADKDDKVRVAAGRAAFVGGVEKFARADPALTVTSDTWDRDTWLLGTPGGTVDLRTGELQGVRLTDYITRLAAVAPAPAGTPHPV